MPAGAIDIAQLNDGAAFASQVVAKGDGFLVQSVRFPLLNPLREMRLPNQPQVGQILLHTALPKGTGRELVRTVTFREWRTRVGSFRHSRIVGVAADGNVCTWRFGMRRGAAPRRHSCCRWRNA